MKPVIPDYDWSIFGVRVMKPVIPDYDWSIFGVRVTGLVVRTGYVYERGVSPLTELHDKETRKLDNEKTLKLCTGDDALKIYE
ncbi:hypothetical protein ACUNHT_09810 [Serratia sp. IR-2025]|uniref:hypothetical protein n=1 Tax=Serratia marcescens TaxID=615 RepID=UPI001A1EA523|nr:hypothetical protein [Serratia marcescens]MDP8638184.1 hypothetical protein [Serratia marcescens]MDP8831752.1 hypothetical protein [Serratia marcescens]HAT2854316.1 hypothetical protein [Serratia marcescens]